jgi:hypothetical protein
MVVVVTNTTPTRLIQLLRKVNEGGQPSTSPRLGGFLGVMRVSLVSRRWRRRFLVLECRGLFFTVLPVRNAVLRGYTSGSK